MPFSLAFKTLVRPNLQDLGSMTIVPAEKAFPADGHTSDIEYTFVDDSHEAAAPFTIFHTDGGDDKLSPGPARIRPEYVGGHAVYLQAPTGTGQLYDAKFVRFDGPIEKAPMVRLNGNPPKSPITASDDFFACESVDGQFALCLFNKKMMWVPYRLLPNDPQALDSVMSMVYPFEDAAASKKNG